MDLKLLAGVAALVMVTGEASAHHSFAMYDRERTLTLTGTVKEYDWASPHVVIEVVKDGSKGANAWYVEGSSPTVLARGGWTSTLVKPGDKITLGIHPRKDGQPGGLLADEREVRINGQPAKGVLWLMPANEDSCSR